MSIKPNNDMLDKSGYRFDVTLDLTSVLCKLIDKAFEYFIDKIQW